MVTASTYIKHKYEDTIRLVPFSDVHADAKDCDWKAFKRDIAKQAAIPNTYFLGLGDYLEGIPVTDKRYRPSSKVFSGKDDQINCALDWFESLVAPAKGKIIGLARGNHEDRFLANHGLNMVKVLADRLGTIDLGMSFLLRIQLEDQHSHHRSAIVYGHHGWGGGSRTAGGNLTKFERTRNSFDADIFLFGHVHGAKMHQKFPRVGLGVSSTKLVAKTQLLGITGTYLRTLSAGADPTYSEAKGYPPSEIGHLVINLKMNKNGLDMWAEG